MTNREKIIAAYECSNEKLPDKRCEKCPFGYEYLDQTGDNYFVGCNTERMMVDAIDLLRAQEPMSPVTSEVQYGDHLRHCPSCGKALPNSGEYGISHYCYKCGQAVKWE